jgi:hypothetical protein
MAVGGENAVDEKALGRVQLRSESGEIILVPKPSSDPNDPLNWSVFKSTPLLNPNLKDVGLSRLRSMLRWSLASECSCVHFWQQDQLLHLFR